MSRASGRPGGTVIGRFCVSKGIGHRDVPWLSLEFGVLSNDFHSVTIFGSHPMSALCNFSRHPHNNHENHEDNEGNERNENDECNEH